MKWNAERAIPHLQMRRVLSEGKGILVSDGDKKPHPISPSHILDA